MTDGPSNRHGQLDLAPPPRAIKPEYYVAAPGLKDAVEVALAVGQPLLVTGEPGTGKTQLAKWVAYEYRLDDPLECNVKTTSVARDLFYQYDALAHFHDVHLSVAQAQRSQGKQRSDTTDVEKYIEYNALGLAILLTKKKGSFKAKLPVEYADRAPARSVVLIDEIDKAPRDLPNDVLNELQNMEFTVKELRRKFEADPKLQPIVVFTSNSERTLPDAFLRRCVYYHISFPEGEVLERIVRSRLRELSEHDDGGDLSLTESEFKRALRLFGFVRDESTQKKPATAELIAFMRVLDRRKKKKEKGGVDLADKSMVAKMLPLLTKTKEDFLLARDRLDEAVRAAANP